MIEEQKNKKRILIRLSKGVTTVEELKYLVRFYEKEYKSKGKAISSLIEWQSFNEMSRRLSSSVFSESGQNYPSGYIKYCIYGEYNNTKMFIDLLKRVIVLGQAYGDITSPEFYGQPNVGYKISIETLIHIILRHNQTINSFINPDSQNNGYNPSSFEFGVFVEPMLLLLMALNVIKDNEWKTAIKGKNLISHFRAGGKEYTIVRKGHSKEILSFYPRNDSHEIDFIELERNLEKMEFVRKMTGCNKS